GSDRCAALSPSRTQTRSQRRRRDHCSNVERFESAAEGPSGTVPARAGRPQPRANREGQLESALPALGKARCVSAEALHRGSERVGGAHGGFGGRRLCPGRKARFLPGEIFYRHLAGTMCLAGDVVKYLPTCTTPDGNQ
ncbi:unnamed protein product, partial [Ascophyllum nodosum]